MALTIGQKRIKRENERLALREAAAAVLANVYQGKLGSGVEVKDPTAGGEALAKLAALIGKAD